MKTLRRLSVRAFFVVATLAAWLALNPAPFTMHVVDEAGRAAAGVRIITDNGIVASRFSTARRRGRNFRSCGEPSGSRCVTITTATPMPPRGCNSIAGGTAL